MYVKPKKNLGQHFLKNKPIAKKIANSLLLTSDYENVLEIGPGTGVVTQYLLNDQRFKWYGVERDVRSVEYLLGKFDIPSGSLIEADFLALNLVSFFNNQKFAVIGNFPYNISSQILFKVLEYRDYVPEVVGMFQKEVAQRIVSEPGSKNSGILSILCQAFYDTQYLFTVHEDEFSPPPKVKSGVIRLTRNSKNKLDCNEKYFFQLVKTAFNQRRKILRNSLKIYDLHWEDERIRQLVSLRAEQLGVDDFVRLTQMIP